VSSFVDTSILLYSVSGIPQDRRKREIAIDILSGRQCRLSLQVLNEFTWQATSPRRLDRMTFDQAMNFVDAWRRFPVVALDLGLFDAARDVAGRTNYSWWDCLAVAAARAAACDTIVTEDLQHGHMIDGVRIENPFIAAG
jgi:predicted nucleic acid-binding protein